MTAATQSIPAESSNRSTLTATAPIFRPAAAKKIGEIVQKSDAQQALAIPLNAAFMPFAMRADGLTATAASGVSPTGPAGWIGGTGGEGDFTDQENKHEQ